MTEIKIALDESAIRQYAEKSIAENMANQYCAEYREAKTGIRRAVEQAVKDIIYSRKDEILEKCVARASAELVRKGIPKLLEKVEK